MEVPQNITKSRNIGMSGNLEDIVERLCQDNSRMELEIKDLKLEINDLWREIKSLKNSAGNPVKDRIPSSIQPGLRYTPDSIYRNQTLRSSGVVTAQAQTSNRYSTASHQIHTQVPVNSATNVPSIGRTTSLQKNTMPSVHQVPTHTFKFVNEYNAIDVPGKSSYDIKNARDAYIKNFRITGFSCTNYEIRMNSPETAPQFRTDSSVVRASFWAFHVQETQYAVLPNQKQDYESQIHDAGGMKEAFQSNFAGGAYSHIKVLAPAIFSRSGDTWTLMKRGTLQLS